MLLKMIPSGTHHFEIKYRYKDEIYTTVISTGIINDTDIVIKFLRQIHDIELIYVRKLNY